MGLGLLSKGEIAKVVTLRHFKTLIVHSDNVAIVRLRCLTCLISGLLCLSGLFLFDAEPGKLLGICHKETESHIFHILLKVLLLYKLFHSVIDQILSP